MKADKEMDQAVEDIVAGPKAAIQIRADQAVLNITWAGQNGDNPDAVLYDSSDVEILRIAQEGIRAGYVPGIKMDATAELKDFVVDRFPATADPPMPSRLIIRPKTPFGSKCRGLGPCSSA